MQNNLAGNGGADKLKKYNLDRSGVRVPNNRLEFDFA